MTDPDGNKGSDSVEISVDALPEIEATATPDTGDAPLEVDFSTVVTTEGELSAFADGTATYPDLTGTASMVRSRGTTVTTLDVTGLKADAAHMVHVHEQACADGNGGAHFRFDTNQPFSEDNEIWLPFTSDADGTSGEVVVTSDQRAGAKAMAIVIHDPDNPAKRIGCVDLDPSTDGLTYAWDFGDGEQAEGADPTPHLHRARHLRGHGHGEHARAAPTRSPTPSRSSSPAGPDGPDHGPRPDRPAGPG